MRPFKRVFDEDGLPVSPARVLRAYSERCFPMADDRAGRIFWIRPAERAVITWDQYRIPRKLRSMIKNSPFRFTSDQAFPQVVEECARRGETWISHDIEGLYNELFQLGHAHSVEAWDSDGNLVGGLYGLSTGGAFAGESMFHRKDNASLLALHFLVRHLQAIGYRMLDCQQSSPHVDRFGAVTIDDDEFALMLATCSKPLPWKSQRFPSPKTTF